MNSPEISIYKSVKDTASTQTISIDTFLEQIREGHWQDQVLKIRTITDKEQRRLEKTKLPNVTLSGFFSKRQDDQLKNHSGFIGIDLDDLAHEVEPTRELLQQDPYVYSVFTSVSGNGLCCLFRVDPVKHKEAFEAISDYLIRKYQLITDPTGINPSRARFVSYDPELHINAKAAVFKKYLPKPKARKITPAIFVQNEFDDIIRQMVDKSVSCVEDYRDWRDIAFGLADKFGEAGRQYFHQLSSCSVKYDPAGSDRQYTHAINGRTRQGNRITISTIYWFAKQEGIQVISERTKKIAAATSTLKNSGLSQQAISETLQKHEDITDADDIIKQAFASTFDYSLTNTLVDNVRMWLRQKHVLRRNLVTRKIENHGVELDDIAINTMFLDCKVAFDEVTHQLFQQALFSNNTVSYNPFEIFLSVNTWDGTSRIPDLARSINSETGDAEFRERMVMKWVVGIVHSMKGGINELNFILVGAKNTGKTTFFRKLLPPALQKYFAPSQLNRGKDDEILMCQKLIVFNDEYGGKNKIDERNEKRLMASDQFDLREPYGRSNVTMRRIASLGGTCNELQVLDDATGNRRIVVLESAGKFNFALYNSIDKNQLLMEAYELWKQGERPVLEDVDIACLEEATETEYSKVSFEQEMIEQYFLAPDKSTDLLSTTEVKLHLELHTRDKINLNKLGARLRKLGYERQVRGKTYCYKISKVPAFHAPSISPSLAF